MKKLRRFPAILLAISLCGNITLQSQIYNSYQNNGFDPISRELYKPDRKDIHTSIKPYRLDEIERHFSTDSLIQRGLYKPSGKINILKRFVHDDLLKWDDNMITVRINPLFNFELGRELQDSRNTWVNTRGIMIEGKLGNNLAFYADIYENQTVLPQYMTDFVEVRGVVPGQGRVKRYKTDGYDFSQANGYLSYNAGQWINLQMGYGKNFIGDGYRSLLLSDNASSYTHLKMTASFWNVKYMWMVAQLQHLPAGIHNVVERFPYKYGAFHYLDWNIGKRFSVGLYESVIWAAQDQEGHRGIDMNYLNPFLFYRPVEHGLGSPDNMLVGANLKFIPWKDAAIYGQIVFNEFKFDEIKARNGWWGNKQGFQIGFKSYNFLGLENLDVQTEYNHVRPFTYAHYGSITNYGHLNQELTHPLGASFRENVSILRYRTGRWHLELKSMITRRGEDKNIDETRQLSASQSRTWVISYGGDIFKPVGDRYGSHGHEIGQGLSTDIVNLSGEISWLVNPKTNMNIAIGGRYRTHSNEMGNDKTAIVFVTLRTSLRNFYYDF